MNDVSSHQAFLFFINSHSQLQLTLRPITTTTSPLANKNNTVNMAAITIPQEYSYVLLAATSTLFVNVYHSLLTSSKRKASGIKYPTTYASEEVADKDPKAYQFNCGMPPSPFVMKRSSR